jgi:RNA 2',3'-cyclic 3'-phosphodiesterase
MSDKTHYFLAVKLPDPIKQSLEKAKEGFQRDFSFKKWVHKEDYHITLAFLGFATENQLKDVEKLVRKYIIDVREFSLTISKIGTFGMKSAPRIFWAGLNDSSELQILRDHVYQACTEAGFQLEKRAFHPHITMARKWSGEEEFHLEQLDEENVFGRKPLSFQATEVVLYRTNLLQTPKYENLITFLLQS